MLTSRTLYVATDHAGFAHKEEILAWLRSKQCVVVDVGAATLDLDDDFPDYIAQAAQAVSLQPETTAAVIFGGSGQGEAMLANRYAGVRATVYYGGAADIVRLSREHNDANVLSIGARFVTIEEAKLVIWEWLNTNRSSEAKYQRRNLKIDARR